MPLSPPWRKLLLALHLTVSVGWIGAVLAYVALDVSVATGQDAETVRTAYLAMERIARLVIVPLAIASLMTGIGISLGTKWGLFRHYWVVISLFLTLFATIVLIRETQLIGLHAGIASDSRPAAEVLALPSTLVHSIGGTAVLLVILVLNIYKPRGLTKYGRRKDRERDRPEVWRQAP